MQLSWRNLRKKRAIWSTGGCAKQVYTTDKISGNDDDEMMDSSHIYISIKISALLLLLLYKETF